MKNFLLLILCLAASFLPNSSAAKKKKKSNGIEQQLRKDIEYLASDALEGRRTGTTGEKLAATYIAQRFKENGIPAYKGGSYAQKFSVSEGKFRGSNTSCSVYEVELDSNDYCHLPFSANGTLSELIYTKHIEPGGARFVPISKVSKNKLSNPHSTAQDEYLEYATKLFKEDVKGIVFYNDIDTTYDYTFYGVNEAESKLDKVVMYINHNAYKKHLKERLKTDWIDFSATVDVREKIREGFNVAAYIDNKAPYTIILGAHYDHLGYGEDHNSLYTDTEPAIHNGADDNASGTAALLALSKMIKEKKLAKYNYLFIAFSGEELGLFGSKKFVENNAINASKIQCMINMDMLGRYNNEKKTLTIGGVGTSPSWIPMIEKSKKFFTPKWDSSGSGPSDHTSFYRKDIPVLFFFTGLHNDYHKPSDDAEKINYEAETKLIEYIFDLITQIDQLPKLTFTKTREPQMGGARFKVSLGIMPDYTYNGPGVKVDGVSDGKVAKEAGILAGDVIVQLGDKAILDLASYMDALSLFNAGDETEVAVSRGKEFKVFKIKFKK